jgi:hypothetical protein
MTLRPDLLREAPQRRVVQDGCPLDVLAYGNITERDIGKSGIYSRVTAGKYSRSGRANRCKISELEGFRTWTENPRVGG